VALVKSSPVDVVLLDADLGREYGGTFLEAAPRAGYDGKVIVVTVGVPDREADRLLRGGAAAIFLKHGTDTSLFRLIRNVVSGSIRSHLAGPKATGAPSPQDDSARSVFTVRQRQVLRLLVQGKANKEIAVELGLRETQVKEALQGLFLKTGVRSRAQLVRLAIEDYWSEVTPPLCRGGE
jgi:two-component system nitrate/nitrite response regulator NarL